MGVIESMGEVVLPGAEVMGRCFVLSDGDNYVGCVSVQQFKFFTTARGTHHDAMLEARKLVVTLREMYVLTDCVCQCHLKGQ
jgi:hypothetical protein